MTVLEIWLTSRASSSFNGCPVRNLSIAPVSTALCSSGNRSPSELSISTSLSYGWNELNLSISNSVAFSSSFNLSKPPLAKAFLSRSSTAPNTAFVTLRYSCPMPSSPSYRVTNTSPLQKSLSDGISTSVSRLHVSLSGYMEDKT